MKMRLAPIALIAVACTGGLTACGATPGTPVADSSASNGTSAQSPDAPGVLGILGVTANPSAPATSGSKKAPRSHVSTPAGTSATSSPSTHPATPAPPPQSANPTSSSGSGGSGTVNFTVPSIPGDNVVSAYGSYTKLNAERVKVTVCAKQTGTAYSVGALALAYNTAGQSKNVGAVVLLGPGNTSCGTITFLFYSAHLTVHAFIGGNNGVIAKTGPSQSLY